LLKGREIKGLPVFAGMKREEIGRVVDMVVNAQSGALESLVIMGGGMWQKLLFVDLSHVRSIDKSGVIVPNKSHIKRLPKNTETLYQKGWMGSKLVSATGEDKGTVADVMIKDGMIKGLEISSGVLGDLRSGREFMPWQNVKVDKNSFIEGNIHDESLS